MELLINISLILGGIATYYLLVYILSRPKSVTNIQHKLRKVNMKVAEVRLFWQQSVSTDVIAQFVNVTVANGEDVTVSEYELPPTVGELLVTVPALSGVNVAITVADATFTSPVVSYDFQVGDLVAPQPVGFISHEIVRIYDSE